MALMPGATFIGPTPNKTPDGMVEVRGLVLHIQQGTEQGSEAWFKNPAAQASAHFLNPKKGGLRQLVDTKDRAWAEAAGNSHWVSVENEGFVPDKLTDSQVENCAQLLAWLHKTYSVPLQSTDDPNGRGLGWHGMGGSAWGGHVGCPGDSIKAQRGAIITRAKEIVGEKSPAKPKVSLAHVVYAARHDPAAAQGHTSHRDEVLLVERALHAEGLLDSRWVDGSYGSKTLTAYAALQRRYGYSGSDADGIPGKASLQRLGDKHGFAVTS
ncbi:N-acetylmuramoyl-L-alanine amidase [Streptomyces sp. NPDC001544]|uniref:peptidoglycan recognition protein family protein n=1 Tax=Streptomyces sp. NPDC001544 TaxID=3364584 RepID=UPI003690795A